MKCPSYDLFFNTFSNRTRIKIIESLIPGPKSVTQICKTINAEQSKISHNLKKLTECHFLDVKRKGKNRVYSLNQSIIPILNLVEKHVKNYCKEVCTRK